MLYLDVMKKIGIIYLFLFFGSNSIFCQERKDFITAAVLPMTGANISNTELTIYSDRLEGELYKLNKFTFVERGLMSEVLKEQGFQQSGCTSDECAVRIGELLGVQVLITGSIGKIGSLHTINLKMIDVETGLISKKFSYDCPCSQEELLISGLRKSVQGMFNIDYKDNSLTGVKDVKSSTIITITSSPQNARVHLGGKYIGKTPLTLVDYKKGSYTMMVLLPGFKIYRSNIKVGVSSQDYDIALEKK